MKSLETLKRTDVETLRQVATLSETKEAQTLKRLIAEALAAQDEENRVANAETLYRGQGAALFAAELLSLMQNASDRFVELKRKRVQADARRHENVY